MVALSFIPHGSDDTAIIQGHLILDSFDGTKHSRDCIITNKSLERSTESKETEFDEETIVSLPLSDDEDSLSNLPNITPSTNRRKSNHQNDSSLQSLPSAKQTQTDPITPQNQRTQDSLATPQTRRTVRSMETPARPPADAVRSTETQTIEMKTIETQTIPTPRPTQTDIQPVLESSRQIDERKSKQKPHRKSRKHRKHKHRRHSSPSQSSSSSSSSFSSTSPAPPTRRTPTASKARPDVSPNHTPSSPTQSLPPQQSRIVEKTDHKPQTGRSPNLVSPSSTTRLPPTDYQRRESTPHRLPMQNLSTPSPDRQVQPHRMSPSTTLSHTRASSGTPSPIRPTFKKSMSLSHSLIQFPPTRPHHTTSQNLTVTNLTKSKLAFHLQVDETTCVSLNRPALPADSPYKNSSAPRTLSDAFTCNSTSGLLDSQGQENLLFTFFPSQVLAGFRLTQKMTLTVQVYGGPSVYEQQYPLTLVGTCESVEDEDVPSPSVRLETQPSFNRPPTFSPSRPIDRVDLLASQKSISPSKHVLVSTAVPDTPAALPFHSPASSSVYQSPQPSPARAMVQEKRWVYCEETFLSFPPTRVGQASSLSLTIVNTFPHSVTLFASPLSTGIPNSKVFTVPYRVIPVRPNSFIRINIEFRPDQRVSHDGTLSFRTEDGNTSLSVDVRGTGY